MTTILTLLLGAAFSVSTLVFGISGLVSILSLVLPTVFSSIEGFEQAVYTLRDYVWAWDFIVPVSQLMAWMKFILFLSLVLLGWRIFLTFFYWARGASYSSNGR